MSIPAHAIVDSEPLTHKLLGAVLSNRNRSQYRKPRVTTTHTDLNRKAVKVLCPFCGYTKLTGTKRDQ